MAYRNPAEEDFARRLELAGIKFQYEAKKIPILIPARTAHYLPDFLIPGTNIVLEYKGSFGGGKGNHDKASVEYRQRMCLLKEQRPDLDIRFVFHSPKSKIYKGSKTTYADWAEAHGFKWCHKTLPPEWVTEIKELQNGKSHSGTQAPRAVSVRAGGTSRRVPRQCGMGSFAGYQGRPSRGSASAQGWL